MHDLVCCHGTTSSSAFLLKLCDMILWRCNLLNSWTAIFMDRTMNCIDFIIVCCHGRLSTSEMLISRCSAHFKIMIELFGAQRSALTIFPMCLIKYFHVNVLLTLKQNLTQRRLSRSVTVLKIRWEVSTLVYSSLNTKQW